jgi:peptidoglycan hydrolase-like protein with peptidoglycan-binding domain
MTRCAVLALFAVATSFNSRPAIAQNKAKDFLKGVVPGIALGIILNQAAKANELRQRRDSSARSPSSPTMAPKSTTPPSTSRGALSGTDTDEALVRDIQQALSDAGFSVGRPDGILGPKGRQAAKQVQSQIGHPQTGWLTPPQLVYLKQRNAGRSPATPPVDAAVPTVDDEEYTMRMQRALNAAGFDLGDVDGRWGSEARDAARAYQTKNGQIHTGRLTPQQLAALERGGTPSPPPVAAVTPPLNLLQWA